MTREAIRSLPDNELRALSMKKRNQNIGGKRRLWFTEDARYAQEVLWDRSWEGNIDYDHYGSWSDEYIDDRL